MTEAVCETGFQFVDWSDMAGPHESPHIRLQIRKQAMKNAAADRKRRGNWGKKNLGQTIVGGRTPPDIQVVDQKTKKLQEATRDGERTVPSDWSHSVKDPVTAVVDDAIASAKTMAPQNRPADTEALPAMMPCAGYESLRIQHNFDLLDVSALATLHVSRITGQILQQDPTLLNKILHCSQWSYFTYIPNRIGHFTCLDDAVRCVAVRVRDWVQGSTKTSVMSLKLYAKALRSLQSAIEDPLLCMEPEILCATEVLAIYEVRCPADLSCHPR